VQSRLGLRATPKRGGPGNCDYLLLCGGQGLTVWTGECACLYPRLGHHALTPSISQAEAEAEVNLECVDWAGFFPLGAAARLGCPALVPRPPPYL
jgi:hypothetical protein